MTKAELIKALEPYPDNMLVCVWDTELEGIDVVDIVEGRDIEKYEGKGNKTSCP
jgi:hypothetical protein